MSGDPTPRLLAAASALTGAAALMVRSEPSWTGVLVGLSCLALWAVGTLASRPGKPLALTKPARPVVLEAVIVERPRPPLLLPPPRAAEAAAADLHPTDLGKVPTRRQTRG